MVDESLIREVTRKRYKPDDTVLASALEKIKPELTDYLISVQKASANKDGFDDDAVNNAVHHIPEKKFLSDDDIPTPADKLYRAIGKLTNSELEEVKKSRVTFFDGIPDSYPETKKVIGEVADEFGKLIKDYKFKPSGAELENLLQGYICETTRSFVENAHSLNEVVLSMPPIDLKQFYESVNTLTDDNPNNDLLALHKLTLDICPQHSAISYDHDETDQKFIETSCTIQQAIDRKIDSIMGKDNLETLPHVTPLAAATFKDAATQIFAAANKDRPEKAVQGDEDPEIRLYNSERLQLAEAFEKMLETMNEKAPDKNAGLKPTDYNVELNKIKDQAVTR